MRLAYVAAWAIAGNLFITGRSDMPFTPLLGETYELVTPGYRYLVEAVSTSPQILAMNCQGDNFEIEWTIESKMMFTFSLTVQVEDKHPVDITLMLPDG